MADQDENLVTVHLDEDRHYRDKTTGQVVTVPKGEAKVPPHIAERWRQRDLLKTTVEPWPGYNDLTVDEISERLPGLSDAEREAVGAYEAANKKRSGVLDALKGK